MNIIEENKDLIKKNKRLKLINTKLQRKNSKLIKENEELKKMLQPSPITEEDMHRYISKYNDDDEN